MSQWIAIGALGLVAIFIPLTMIGLSWLLRPSVPKRDKRAVYESGEVPTGSVWGQFNIQYYLVALLFVIFDIETALLFPWALTYFDALAMGGAVQALVPMLVFIGILLLGLAWAWRTGAVQWIRSQRRDLQRGQTEQ